jgi:ribosomal protein S18 acetylase RimI-like enzyme
MLPDGQNATMPVRRASREDALEIVRLAEVMYQSMGVSVSESWRHAAREEIRTRLDRDLVAFVVDQAHERSALCSSGCGTIARRLPSPANPTGAVGYIQWVATDAGFRRRGFGHEVMRALIAWFDEQAVPVIELHATPAGESIYRRLGFDEYGGVALRRRSTEASGSLSSPPPS